eukprot:CAMPEP_0171917692 /NCGR_PEP_ID=MMETSP0993-20121228/16274_1 /TAXON_ID=483369 /ORGANISM="non described non described, Strain CCMP2098" /LENGTH=122 /DNA_ID=CAMNT_0012553667 /DNA_START=276 /DNA_END=644 /DNA_ORIENTATION=+
MRTPLYGENNNDLRLSPGPADFKIDFGASPSGAKEARRVSGLMRRGDTLFAVASSEFFRPSRSDARRFLVADFFADNNCTPSTEGLGTFTFKFKRAKRCPGTFIGSGEDAAGDETTGDVGVV